MCVSYAHVYLHESIQAHVQDVYIFFASVEIFRMAVIRAEVDRHPEVITSRVLDCFSKLLRDV